MIEIEHSLFWLVVLTLISITFISLAILSVIKIAYSQDIDPNAACMRPEYPYNVICGELMIREQWENLTNDLR